jgi:hypothetical protein
MNRLVAVITLAALAVALSGAVLCAKEDVTAPKEFGVYVKMKKTTKRLLPNIVFDEKGVLYLESNSPPRFPLGEVEQFIVHGQYEIKFLTLNPMLFVTETPLGKSRFLFGKDIELQVTKKSDVLYAVKPKGLFGRGYYSLWINDSAWDFVIE